MSVTRGFDGTGLLEQAHQPDEHVSVKVMDEYANHLVRIGMDNTM